MCSFEIIPTTSDGLPRPPVFMRTAMAALRRDNALHDVEHDVVFARYSASRS
jgi:hypothetical protein